MARVHEGSHSFTCHPHAYSQLEWAILSLIPSHSASPHFGRYSFPVPQRVGAGGWVGLGGWLHAKVICPPKDGHPSQYQPTDSAAAGIELTSRKSDALTTRLPSRHCAGKLSRWVVVAAVVLLGPLLLLSGRLTGWLRLVWVAMWLRMMSGGRHFRLRRR